MKYYQMSIGQAVVTITRKYIAKIIKENRPPKYKYQIIDVKADQKYGYFIVTTKIYRHEIIEIIRFENCDRIELYLEGEKTPFKTVERNSI